MPSLEHSDLRINRKAEVLPSLLLEELINIFLLFFFCIPYLFVCTYFIFWASITLLWSHGADRNLGVPRRVQCSSCLEYVAKSQIIIVVVMMTYFKIIACKYLERRSVWQVIAIGNLTGCWLRLGHQIIYVQKYKYYYSEYYPIGTALENCTNTFFLWVIYISRMSWEVF